MYNVHVRVNPDHVLGLLLEKEQFIIARKYAELVQYASCQFSIKEVCIQRGLTVTFKGLDYHLCAL